MAIAITLHVLAVVIWVGGMFFAYMAQRPAAMGLEPPQRLPLWARTFARFFPWVWASVILLPATGYYMIYRMGGFGSVGLYVHIMQGLGILMILIFLHVFFAPYRRLNKSLAVNDIPGAGKQLATIRKLIGLNLSIGIILIAIVMLLKNWG
jgi:uncharacterized membrane protein